MKEKLKIAAGAAVTIAILYFTCTSLGGFNPAILFKSEINWGVATLSALVFLFSNFVRCFVYTRGIDRRLPLMDAFRIVLVGNAANMVLPLRAGEGVRLTLFPHGYGAAKRTRLAMLPGVADIAAVLLLSLLAIPFAGFHSHRLVQVLHILALVCGAAAVAVLLLAAFVPRLQTFVGRLLREDMRRMYGWVLASWLLNFASIWVGLCAFGYSGGDALRYSFAIFAATNIVMFLPSSPGGIGIFEYGVVLGFEAVGITEPAGKAVGLLLHLVQYAALLPLGAALYFTRRRPLREPAVSKHHGKRRFS